MAKLGGSPLGLVGLNSFSINNNNNNYNNRTRKNGTGNVSLFSGDRIVRPFPISVGGNNPDTDVEFSNKNSIHSNDLYNTTIDNIVNRLKGTKAELSFMDFAYLKDVGVYPNNRLMIARRFATPQPDNIMYSDNTDLPLVTLISWKPTTEDFISINFGEVWEDVSDGSFTSILTDIGKDLRIPGDLGKYLGGGANVTPLPGSTETLQRKLLQKLGILEEGSDQTNQIPEGNPNIIKQAKKRKLVGAGSPGSGLSCKVSIKMTCTWEQKFIEGIDPTLAWMDIISMVTRFGTSTSQTYGLSNGFSNKVKDILKDPVKMIRAAIESLKDSVNEIINNIKNKLKSIKSKSSNSDQNSNNQNKPPEKSPEQRKIESETSLFDGIKKQLMQIGEDIINTLVKKYRERIIGVINVLSGLPSTPWHITIGNPLRPTFCSGDMITTDINLKLGPHLSFNDLPTTITAEFTLSNARSWGLQEILAKFNSGYLRVLSYKQDDKGTLDRQGTKSFSLVGDRGTTINEDKVDLTLNSNNKVGELLAEDIETPSTDELELFVNNNFGESDIELNIDPNSDNSVLS